MYIFTDCEPHILQLPQHSCANPAAVFWWGSWPSLWTPAFSVVHQGPHHCPKVQFQIEESDRFAHRRWPGGSWCRFFTAGWVSIVCVAGGARDSCHIRIKPPANNSQCYFSRKLFHSVLLQDITSHQGNFMEIFVWYRGSVLDARVLKNSPVYTGRLYPPAGRCLVRRTWLREPLGCSKHAGAPSKSCLHARSCCVLCGAPQSLIARGSQSCSVRIHQPLPHCHGLCVNVYLATVLLNSMTDACVIVQFFKL